MQGGTGCGARGRGFAATPPGGPGSPSAPTTWGCLQWLDEAWMKGGESCLDEVSAPGSTVPGTEKPRWSAVWRTCLSQRHVNAARRWTAGCAARRSIPLPLQGTGGTQRRASPGPRQRIRVAERWLRLFEIGCLTIESENRERKNARAPHSAHSRASGNPALGPRLRGDERMRVRARCAWRWHPLTSS